jgi:NADH:quinone reductase (non-electrogenic)
MNTRFTDLFGVEHPIVHGGMQWVGRAELVSGARGRTVYETGDPDAGVWTAGLVQGLIHDIPTVAELVGRIVGEAEQIIIERLAGAVGEQLSWL